jgi:hypothetical protein
MDHTVAQQSTTMCADKSVKVADATCLVCRRDIDYIKLARRCFECRSYVHSQCTNGGVPDGKASTWYCTKCSPQMTLGTCWIPLADTTTDDGVLALLGDTTGLPKSYERFE